MPDLVVVKALFFLRRAVFSDLSPSCEMTEHHTQAKAPQANFKDLLDREDAKNK